METHPDYPYSFDPGTCETCPGRCCNGESGNIWVTRKEIQAIAGYLNITTNEFIETHLRKKGYRFTLIELKQGDNYACVFFDHEKNGCSIYPVRPSQCRTFPFWPHFKAHPGEVFEECPGVRENEEL